jgi:predicted ribosomally synthesized peptide with nif11-like leader
MSEEQLKAFLEAVKADAGLQEKLKGAADVDAVVAIAKSVGYAISVDELKKSQAAEISDEELEGVAGGGAGAAYIVLGAASLVAAVVCISQVWGCDS